MLSTNEQSMYHLETLYIILGQKACVWYKMKDICSHTGVADIFPFCVPHSYMFYKFRKLDFSSIIVNHNTGGSDAIRCIF